MELLALAKLENTKEKVLVNEALSRLNVNMVEAYSKNQGEDEESKQQLSWEKLGF